LTFTQSQDFYMPEFIYWKTKKMKFFGRSEKQLSMDFLTILPHVPTSDPASKANAKKVTEFLNLVDSNYRVTVVILAGQLYMKSLGPDGEVLVNASCRDTGKDIHREFCEMTNF